MLLGLRSSSIFSGRAAAVRQFRSSSKILDSDYEFDFTQLKNFRKPLGTVEVGVDCLHDPLFNKGTGFKHGERDRMKIRGLIPPRRLSMQSQISRVLQSIREEPSPIKKNIMLEDLHDRNETLYHRILVDYIEEMAPIIYTPTVGQACKEFGVRFRRPRGMYFSSEDRGQMAAMVYNWPHNDVRVIVVTDGSRILGLGDLGANGMGIPIGKLSLYCAAGGIAPHRVLPVCIDVGTNNKELLNNPYYLGIQQERLTGVEYFSVVDEFMQAIKHRWPNALVQFEDFQSEVAQPLLNNYRKTHLTFNDDIQGTGATVLAGCLSALRAKGAEVTSLGDEKIVIAGAGSAGIGVATVLYQAMLEQGRTEQDALDSFFIADQHGLLTKDRTDLNAEQIFFAKEAGTKQLSLMEIVQEEKPTILMGVTTVGGLFKEELIREMAKHVARPIIFPLSNPTSSAECTAEQAYEWSGGKCVFASGSPFDPVTVDGKKYTPTQCNNMFVFPGMGLGATLCGAKHITDRMLYIAAVALANFVDVKDLEDGKVFPPVNVIRDVSKAVACAIIREAVDKKLATRITKKELDNMDLDAYVEKMMYNPVYVPLVEKQK